MTAQIYVRPLTRVWLQPRHNGEMPAVHPAFKRRVTPEGLRILWVALPIGYRYFDYLPCADNDCLVRA